MKEAWRERLETLPEVGKACRAGGAVSEAMVVANPGDDVHATRLPAQLPVKPGNLVGRVVCLGAARREIRHLQVAGSQLCQLGGQLDRRCGAEAAICGAERKSFHLLGGGVGKHGSAVANVHVPQRRHAVDVIASVDISEGCASTAGEDQLRYAARGRIQVALRMEPVGPVELVQPARFATF